jgi:hypothetical protein
MPYRTVKAVSPVDAAYMAGLIDREGTVTLSRRHRNDQRQLVVSIANTERRLLEWTLDTVGAGKITGKRISSPLHSPSFTYSIANRQALQLLEQIAPYLRSYKATRTKLILQHYINLTPGTGVIPKRFVQSGIVFSRQYWRSKPRNLPTQARIGFCSTALAGGAMLACREVIC